MECIIGHMSFNFNHYQTLHLQQTNRFISRIQLPNHFKQQAFESIGINQQRMGTPIAQQTATGVTQAMNQSFSQTEQYFTQHSDHLMPRVHQMRTDLAQYYYSTNPSVRLSYISTEAEKVNFQINPNLSYLGTIYLKMKLLQVKIKAI